MYLRYSKVFSSDSVSPLNLVIRLSYLRFIPKSWGIKRLDITLIRTDIVVTTEYVIPRPLLCILNPSIGP